MLSKIWKQQKKYNEKIFKIEGTNERNYWTRQYLLGLTAQIAQVLDEIQWKRNKKEDGKRVVPLNLLEVVADIMKFSISIAQIWGFSAEDLLNAMYEKGEILDFKLDMEFKEPLRGKKILITDIDGTIADYRKSFLEWLFENKNLAPSGEATTMQMDSTLEIKYPHYYAFKEEYEETGGYRNLIPYDDAVTMLKWLKEHGWYIIAVTARPAKVYKRIYKDTLHWFNKYDLPIDELHMLGEERILMACELAKNNTVVLWEDDPNLLTRASKSGISTYARRQPYNKDINLPCIALVNSYERDFI